MVAVPSSRTTACLNPYSEGERRANIAAAKVEDVEVYVLILILKEKGGPQVRVPSGVKV